jgi:two-component system LytT family sensor kinase
MLFPLTWPIGLPEEFWIKQVLTYFIWVGLFYSNLLFFAPRLLYKNKVGSFIILLICILIFTVYLNRWVDHLIGVPAAMAKTFAAIGHRASSDHSHTGDYITIISALVLLGASTITAISKKIQADKLAFQTTEKEKISSELSFLKAQINPHFFFNILHTIYALADSNIGAAKDAIYTLSHMMRYVIYETKNDLTTLEKEIQFAEDYVKLMKLRLTDDVQVIFEKQANMKNYEVAPMLFLPFIENAFKHGISTVLPSYVYIDIRQLGNTLKIEIKNSLFDGKSENLEDSNGIGVANTKRRLDLLYPNKYRLTVDNDRAIMEYTVALTLDFK